MKDPRTMLERERKKLKREELLDMILALYQENERLQAELDQCKQALQGRIAACHGTTIVTGAQMTLDETLASAQMAIEQYFATLARMGKDTPEQTTPTEGEAP